MAISSSDILFKYSLKTGTAGNQNPQSDPNASLGKYISTTLWAGGTLHDLFDPVTGTENLNNNIDYRCIFIHNNHGSLTFTGVVIWIFSTPSVVTTESIGVDPALASAITSSTAQAAQVSIDTATPAGVTFSAPLTEGAGLSIGDLPPGQCRAIWIKRATTNSAALNNDGVTLSFSGDTAA